MANNNTIESPPKTLMEIVDKFKEELDTQKKINERMKKQIEWLELLIK